MRKSGRITRAKRYKNFVSSDKGWDVRDYWMCGATFIISLNLLHPSNFAYIDIAFGKPLKKLVNLGKKERRSQTQITTKNWENFVNF